MKLIFPSVKYQKSYLEALEEGKEEDGKKMLKMALLEAKKLGLSKALITCDISNTASAKVIEANNGVLENIVEVGKNLPPKKRYWITIK